MGEEEIKGKPQQFTSTTIADFQNTLQSAWSQSDAFFESLLSESWLERRPISLRNPFIFYYGHLVAFAWNQFRNKLGLEQFEPVFDYIFERGIDPDVDDPAKCHSHPEFPDTWPSKVQIYRYKQKKCPHIVQLVYEHELMHLETLFYMFMQMEDRDSNGPFLNISIPPIKLSTEKTEYIDSEPSVWIGGGHCCLGRDRGKEFGWDIEFPSHCVSVHPFRMHIFPVTIEYWNEEDFLYMKKENIWFPSLWKCLFALDQVSCAEDFRSLCVSAKQFLYRMPFGDVCLKEAFYLPVYVSLAEAEAYAKWKGKRLPSEEEIHGVLYGFSSFEKSHAKGNYGFQYYGPVPVGWIEQDKSSYGVVDVYGNGWELTSTPLYPFPGYQQLPEYPNYSADFFDNKHFVTVGASWATDSSLCRPSFRNWYQRRYRFVFSKFHLVE
ncbi:Meiotically up-regulated gene 158 protein [Galdieria sulphuraria]|nr:Meiotically up-regulated gene 158 protein [Galdieria sulphuraria]